MRRAMESTMQVSPPWVTYVSKIRAMFELDPDVSVKYDNAERALELMVDGQDKADALSRLLPTEKEFGSVTLKIAVRPSNSDSFGSLVRKAFAGNGAVSSIEASGEGVPFISDKTYVLFAPVVVQFFNDDLRDYNGLCTTIYQDIAREIFEVDGSVSFCTELADR